MTRFLTISVLLAAIFAFVGSACFAEQNPAFANVTCEGDYQHHLQGVCTNEANAIFWSFTTELVKTNRAGRVLKTIPVVNHHGDLCFHDGKVYVAVNLGRYNDPEGNDSWVYVYHPETLELLSKQATPEVIHGASGIGVMEDRFYVVGCLPDGVEENYVYEYDAELQFIQKHVIKSGWTQVGIQTAAYHDGAWWFGCYGSPPILLKTDTKFRLLGRYEFDCSIGIVGVARDRLLVAKGPRTSEGRYWGSLHLAKPDAKSGLASILAAGIPALGDQAANSSGGNKAISVQEMKKLRKKAAHRRRRIIFNSDAGNIDPGELSVATREDFLRARKAGLVGSNVDTIFECTDIGFSHYSHHSDIFTVALGWNPVLKKFIGQGTDPLKMTVEFCREHNMEVFWSFRTNDNHDSWTEEGPLSDFKKEHPEYLFGTRNEPPRFGHWTGVDYALPEVRQHVFDILQDVCSRYEIDGIELDFFRTLTNFKSMSRGENVTQKERDAMTELVRRVRKMMDDTGARRGRPLLIAVRVPDSPAYCKAIGLDLYGWLEEDLIDIMVVGGYFWLQPWERSVELGHKYDVPVYPSLSGSRLGGYRLAPALDYTEGAKPESLLARRSEAAYRAHAQNAWEAGVAGIYLFNFNHMYPAPHRLWTDLGDPQKLATLDKIYHLTVMGRGHDPFDYYLPKGRGERFFHLPLLSPETAKELQVGNPLVRTLDVADDLHATIEKGLSPGVRLNVQLEHLPSAGALSMRLNGVTLQNVPLTWESRVPETWQEYSVDPRNVNQGDNSVEIRLANEPGDGATCVCHDVHLRISYV